MKRIVFSFSEESYRTLKKIQDVGQFATSAEALRAALSVINALQQQGDEGFTEIIVRNSKSGDERVLEMRHLLPPVHIRRKVMEYKSANMANTHMSPINCGYANEIAAKMIGEENLTEDLVHKLNDVDALCRRAGGQLVSRQIIAMILNEYYKIHK